MQSPSLCGTEDLKSMCEVSVLQVVRGEHGWMRREGRKEKREGVVTGAWTGIFLIRLKGALRRNHPLFLLLEEKFRDGNYGLTVCGQKDFGFHNLLPLFTRAQPPQICP